MDAVQETFIKYSENEKNYRHDCSCKTMLLVITRNYCYNRLKSKGYNNSRIEDEFFYGSYNVDYDLKISLEDAIQKLPPALNELLYLKEYEGFSYKEIAEITDQSMENIKIKLFRARQLLKKLLTDYE